METTLQLPVARGALSVAASTVHYIRVLPRPTSAAVAYCLALVGHLRTFDDAGPHCRAVLLGASL